MNPGSTYTARGRISKSKLARMYDFSPSSLRHFLNKEIFHKIEPLGYRKNCKFVSAKVVAFIVGELGEPK